MKIVVPQEVVERAAALRANGTSWARIARAVGFGEERVRRILDPGFAARRAAGIRQARFTRGYRDEPHRRLTDAEARQALATVPPDTRSFAARIMGDPLPGRSALDRRNDSDVKGRPVDSEVVVDRGKYRSHLVDRSSFGEAV